MVSALSIRPAEHRDQTELARLINTAEHSYHHLDWSPPLDWLGRHPFWISEDRSGIRAALAVIEDPPGIAWVRLYSCRNLLNPGGEWGGLFDACLDHFHSSRMPVISALGLRDWFSLILESTGFRHHQAIVTLLHEISEHTASLECPQDCFIRPMELDDLPAVAEIDRLAFEPIWQNSLPQIEVSYHRAVYATVAQVSGQIAGFQISTKNLFSAHLARLAIAPHLTRKRIGLALIYDLIERCKRDYVWQLSVNTQDDNLASLALYQKAGFRLTGEEYSVWKYKPR
ncbi:MAG: GNAT family N-acetyltransferase [Chloroflexota bacterium]|jgi:ribosomal protein S18 acetylase RimI-like enzyme